MASTASKSDKIIKYASLGVLVLQNTSLVLFMRFVMTGNRPKFLKAISVFYAEIFKFFASIFLVICQERSVIKGLRYIYDEYVNHWRDAVKVLVPAVVYTIQNFLLYVAVENLPAATYMVTYQLKILTTAIFTVFVLNRKLSIQQWVALLFLFAGVAVVQYDQKISNDRERLTNANLTLPTLNLTSEFKVTTTPEPTVPMTMASLLKDGFESITESSSRPKREVHEQNSVMGFLAVLVACVLSGFAGIYFEKILKGSNVSIWIRNIQLALPSIVFALLFAFVKDNSTIFQDGVNPVSIFTNMMRGFDWAVWVTIGISAFGGLVVAVVIKYADNILKAFATSFAIVLNCVLAFFLFDFRPTVFFLVGATFVIGAVFVYSLYPYRTKHQPVATNEEEAELKEIKATNKNN